jgi:hypothetical protein
MDVFSSLLSDRSKSKSIGDVVDSALTAVTVVNGVRAGHAGVGVAGLLFGRVDVAVAVVVVSELILFKTNKNIILVSYSQLFISAKCFYKTHIIRSELKLFYPTVILGCIIGTITIN